MRGSASASSAGGLARRTDTMRYHAFIDESQRKDRYLLTAALVPTSEVAAVSRVVRALTPRGSQRTHLSAERPAARRAILDAYARLPVIVLCAVTEYHGGDDQLSRNICIRILLRSFVGWRVGVATFDTRQPARDVRDRHVIADAINRGGAPQELHYVHRGSRDEVLLSVPDAIGWAIGAGGLWQRHLAPLELHVLNTNEP